MELHDFVQNSPTMTSIEPLEFFFLFFHNVHFKLGKLPLKFQWEISRV